MTPACPCSWDCVTLDTCCLIPHHVFVPGTVFYADTCCILPHHVFVPGTVSCTGYMLYRVPPSLCSWDCVLRWIHVASCPTMSLFLGLCLTLDTCCILPPPCLCSWDFRYLFVPGTVSYTGYMLHHDPSMSLFLGLCYTGYMLSHTPPCLCSWDCVLC